MTMWSVTTGDVVCHLALEGLVGGVIAAVFSEKHDLLAVKCYREDVWAQPGAGPAVWGSSS